MIEQEIIHFDVPTRVSNLPMGLVLQLEAYRQLKVNRWRVERVISNSYNFRYSTGLYFDQQIADW